ncbi:amylo-alpha-1,6-glucosidase [Mesorhizobium sp. WSM4307]|uniref:amylo-alpha-1,6-glucosidase n=1 Tax=unclassified Mesorhizobium TaxID=325217 RepID=UPI00115DF1AD|nr:MULTISPECIES: amylo-alpha-1,6-glucosidase [unclassified Mesorhizobium]TRC77983.1 amylo-alpha-1,6-glucosidase [Mesorhizobium sp. WSM4315]TRC78620.1 amylo-alpha-1,6-glucosidase [Mesorhizobium sp. WSM4307]TRC80247.1 amylo-alpha-1,6-glucosidase [Mesorhizobium sp. WSM4310]
MSAEIEDRKLDPAVALPAMDESAPREPHRQFALKHEDCFIVADSYGDIRGTGDGLFRDDTRVLSRFRLFIGGRIPSLLGASLSQDNILFTANLTNLATTGPDGRETLPGVVHVDRTRFIWQNRMFERVTFTNYSGREVLLPVRFDFDADFRDMFEVRGTTRSRRGHAHDALIGEASVMFRYEGLDNLARQSIISFSTPPDQIQSNHAVFFIVVGRRDARALFVEVGHDEEVPSSDRFRAAAARARFAMRSKRRQGATVFSSGRVFNDWLTRTRADIALLTTDLETGPYPYAGIPWFSTAFGRDGVISALQMLWLNPELARGVLAFLARYQSTETSIFDDSEPGKIMHETRKGEMAVLRELPFGRYYGGVDTTPLYVYLACSYADRTADEVFVNRMWDSLCAAVGWIEDVGRRNGEGFVTYSRAADTGLFNQGWKDSADAIFHADGTIPRGPIALVEVQGYVFAAYQGMATLAARRGDTAKAARWSALAESIRSAVERHFWMPDHNFYALAIDGEGKQCAVRASNAGHLLYVGLASAERASSIAEQLFSGHLNSGWGVRTLADDEVPFNPMSYHNGSIWPHDTAICAAGLARYQERAGVVKLMSSMFEAAVRFNMRLPELFCGFTRAIGDAPVAYPVACLPQAWSAGSAFMMLQACLGIRIDGWNRTIEVDRPRLPIGIDNIVIRHLAVGEEKVDLTFERVGDHIVCYLDERHEGLVPLEVRS